MNLCRKPSFLLQRDIFPRKYLYSSMANVEKLHLKDGNFIGYKRNIPTKEQKNKPGIIFCSGFMGSLAGIKATYVHEYCIKNDLAYVRFDYFGHSFSSGTMQDFSVSIWKQNTLDVIDHLTNGPQMVIGSSFGGYLALLAAIERPHRVHSIITIANACDGPSNIFFLPDKKEELEEVGITVTDEKIEDAKRHCLLNSTIPIACPVRLFHGMNDDVIPYETSVKVAECLKSSDVRVHLVKDADHNFGTDENLHLVIKTMDELLNPH